MKKNSLFLTLIFLFGFLSACNQQSSVTPVGIINLEKISKETGSTIRIQKEIQDTRNRLNASLQTLQKKLTTDFQESQKKLGKNPTDKQRAELGKTLTHAKLQMQNAQQKAAAELKKTQDKLIINLRKSVQPVAQRIAQQHGMQIILFENKNIIFGKDARVDITDEVIAAMKKQGGNLPEKK